MAVTDLERAAEEIASAVRAGATGLWRVTPSNLLPETFGEAGLSLAQVLYGLSAFELDRASGAAPTTIDVPASRSDPDTISLLEQLGCETCHGTAWSLKPARIRLSR